MMKKYGWSLEDAVEFVRVKNIEMELKPSHVAQLQMYAKKLRDERDKFFFSAAWSYAHRCCFRLQEERGPAIASVLDPDLDANTLSRLDHDQIVLRNTVSLLLEFVLQFL